MKKKKAMKEKLSFFLALAMSISLLASPAGSFVSNAEETDEESTEESTEESSLFDGITINTSGNVLKKHGDSAQLVVNVTGDKDGKTLSYQWMKEVITEDDDEATYEEIENANESVYTVPSTDAEAYEEITYKCEITAEADETSETQSVTFRVLNSGTLSCVVYQNSYIDLDAPEDINLIVDAYSTEDEITYQWCKPGEFNYDTYEYEKVEIPGATESVYTIPADELTNGYTEYTCRVSDGTTTLYSEWFEVSCNFVDVEYENYAEVLIGNSATLKVDATTKTDEEITYQWFKRGDYNYDTYEYEYEDLSCDQASYTTEVFENAGDAYYLCKVSAGSIYSKELYFHVHAVETLSLALTYEDMYYYGYDDDDNYISDLPELSVTANKENVSYQWYKNETGYDEDDNYFSKNIIIDGAINSTYTPEKDQLSKRLNRFICEVTDENNNTQKAYIYVCYDSGLSVDLYADKYACKIGDQIQIRADAEGYEGDGEISYQWYITKDDGETQEILEDETDSTLEYTMDEAGELGFICEVSNASGSTSDEYYINAFDLADFEAIASGDVIDLSLEENEEKLLKFTPEKDGTYRVASSGNGGVWLEVYDSDFDYVRLSGDDENDNFNLTFDAEADETYYLRIVEYEDFDGKVSLREATDDSTILKEDEQYVQFFIDDGSGDISVDTNKTEGLTYQWYFWDQDEEITYKIPGATEKTYHASTTDSKYYEKVYQCEVSDGENTETEVFYVDFVRIMINGDVSISDEAYQGQSKTMTVDATCKKGKDALTYKWYYWGVEDYVIIDGETGSSLTVNIDFSDSDDVEYRCVVSDGVATERVYFEFYETEDTHVHEWETEYTVDKEATCTEAGSKSIHCSICDDIQDGSSVEIPALGHKEVSVEGKAATCTEPGLTEGKKCSVCGKIIEAQEEIPALGHTEVSVEGKAATCTEPGLTEGKKCSVCGETIEAQEEIPALGHTEVKDEAVAATCTETGLTEGSHCSVCGETIEAQEEIPALGHEWDEGTVTKDSTCSEEGNRVYKCTREGCDATKEEAIEVKDHTWEDDYTVDVEATCTGVGSKSIHCANCDAVKDTETIEALGHEWTEWEDLTFTSSESSGQIRTCDRCGETEIRDLALRVAVKKTQQLKLSNILFGKLTYKMSSTKIATVSSSGLVKGVKVGTTTLTVKAAGDSSHAAREVKIKITVPTTITKVELSKTSYTYNGNEQRPSIKKVNSSTKLVEGKDYTTEWQENPVKPGTYKVIVRGIGKYIGTKTATYKITKANQSVSAANQTVYVKESVKVEPTAKTNSFTYKSSSTKIAKVDAEGNITGVKAGTTYITITAKSSDCYNSASKKIKVKVIKKSQGENFVTSIDPAAAEDGKIHLTVGEKAQITASGVGKITYATSNKKYATVSSSGVVKAVKAGTAKITVKAAGNTEYNATTKTYTIVVTK